MSAYFSAPLMLRRYTNKFIIIIIISLLVIVTMISIIYSVGVIVGLSFHHSLCTFQYLFFLLCFLIFSADVLYVTFDVQRS